MKNQNKILLFSKKQAFTPPRKNRAKILIFGNFPKLLTPFVMLISGTCLCLWYLCRWICHAWAWKRYAACACGIMSGMQSICLSGRLRWFGKGLLSVFPVLLFGFQTYAQCADPVVVKATQTAAEGKIALAVSGGIPFEARNTCTSFYKYRWRDAAGKLLSLQKDVSGLVPGTYTVAVSDNLGCKTVNTYTLKGLPELLFSKERLYFLDTRLTKASFLYPGQDASRESEFQAHRYQDVHRIY